MFEATTILAYKGAKGSVIGGDGQVTFGNTVLKGNATKIRKIGKEGNVLAGFAGSTADAFNLFDMFEKCLDGAKGDLLRAVIEFSKQWRKDKYLRKLEAMMLVLDRKNIFLLSGTGDVVEPDDGKIAAIGSGGNYALAAARALCSVSDLSAREIAERSLHVAADICVYTNHNVIVEEIG